MAFGDALRPDDGATVRLNVDISEVSRLEQAEAQWRESVGTMSRESLKLSLAQERLKKALVQYGAESSQAKRATIALREAEESATRSADRHGRELGQTRRQLDRVSRGALLGSGAFRGLARSITFASASFLGGAGFIYAARSALNASSNLAEQQDFANRMFGEGTIIVENYARNALGLARDQAYESAAGIGALLVKFTDSQEAAAQLSVNLTKLAVDLASIKNTSPEEALTALRSGLVGETEPLRRYAILLNAASVEQEALRMTGKASAKQLTEGEKVLARVNIITREAAYAQGNYADTIDSTANQEREFQKNLRNTSILIGDTLQPAYRELIGRVNEYLGDAENQRKVQEQVNRAMDLGEDVVRGFAGALRVVRDVARPVVNLLGGMENTVKLLLLAFAVSKVIAFAQAIRLIGANAIFARRQLTLLAATPVVPGIPGGRGLPIPPVIAANPATAIIVAGGILAYLGIKSGQRDALNAAEFARLKEAVIGGYVSEADLSRVRQFLTAAQRREIDALRNAPDVPDREGRGPRVGARPSPTEPATGGGGRTGAGARTEADIDLDIARALRTPGTSDEARFLREKRDLYLRQIAGLERRKNLTTEQKQALEQLYGQVRAVEASLADIAEDNEAKIEAEREAARERRRKAREAAERKEQRELDAFERETRQRDLRRARRFGAQGGFGGGLGAAAIAARNRSTAGAAAGAGGGLTEADVRRMHFEFLAGLQGVTNQFGSNIRLDGGAGGEVATNTWTMAQLTREQNRMLDRLSRSVQHPGAKYARTELSLAYGGVGGI